MIAALFWPGVPMYDTVSQYDQVLSNDVADWHPPIMVRLWQVLQPLGTTTAPMFALQVVLYAAGFGLIVAALVLIGRWRAALGAAVLALSPLLLGWQMVVLKDAQMLGALVASFGVVAHFRLAEKRVPLAAAGAVALLLGYATLVRANALFATVPLTIFLLPRPENLPGKIAIVLAAILVLLGVTPILNQRLFHATESGIANSQPLFDLAAIAVATPHSVLPFTQAERAQILRKHCVKSFFWDPVGDPSACGPVTDPASELPQHELYLDLARAAAAHPVAYAVHRLKHWNSTERWLVPPGLIDAGPPDVAEQNDEGLRTPASPFVPLWQGAGALEAGTPLGWPIVWTTIAALLLPVAWRRRDEPAGALAFALVVSALTLEASFLVISIASDLRYHLWPMTAAALALVLLSNGLRRSRRAWTVSGALLAFVVAGGLTTRASLPTAPDSYQAMLHAPSD